MRKSKGNSEAFFPAGGAPRKWLPGSWAASRRLALSVTANAVPAPPKGEPSKQPARGLQKAKSCLPLWGRWTRVSEDGEGSPPEACRRPSLASPFGGRWCPVGTVQRLVSAAASVGDGRSPLGCITRAGRRECPRRGRRGGGASGTSPKQSLFALTYRPAVPYNHTTSWGSSLLGLPSGNVNTLANAWYCLKKRDSWKTSIWHGVFSASLFSCAGHPEFWR